MTAKILVVDDEPDFESLILQRFRRQIRSDGMSFLFAHDGVDALALLGGRDDIDLVLCDINMPRMDGLALMQKLREGNSELAIVIVSAYGDMANIRTAMNRGAFDFLTKPIDLTDLEMTIRKTIRHVETLREARRLQSKAERAHASLSRHFSPKLAERLARANSPDLGGESRDVAVMCTDIASFTSLVESIELGVLAQLLNEYLDGTTAIVFAHEGTVAKIVGDSLQVLFGAPDEQLDRAHLAVACALDLDRFSQDFRERWRRKGIALGRTRIGVHIGPAIVGNFGGGRFFDYSAHGETIYTAAHLQRANKNLGTRICVSEAIARRVPDFKGRSIGELMLPGHAEPLSAYEPMRAGRHSAPATEAYAQAFVKLVTHDPAAISTFSKLVGMWPDDPLASFHLRRLLNGASGTRIETV